MALRHCAIATRFAEPGCGESPDILHFTQTNERDGYFEVPFREQRHTPFFLFHAIKKAGGTNQYPLYQTRETTLFIWQDILKHFEALAPPDRKLLPGDPGTADALQTAVPT
ncbi:MAG: hypothetical protein U9R74_05140 [Pseudomonadota bacterium]|nr:hypothetical protein [Pseudomonadota bacterium]